MAFFVGSGRLGRSAAHRCRDDVGWPEDNRRADESVSVLQLVDLSEANNLTTRAYPWLIAV